MMFASIQEAEEQDFSPQSEAGMCLVEAGQLFGREASGVRAKAEAARVGGSVVVLWEAPRFCRATDALVGVYACGFDAVGSIEEAEALMAVRCDDEATAKLLLPDGMAMPQGMEPVTVAAPTDDCPF